MMLTELLGDLPSALEKVRGSAAVALLHDGDPGRLQLAKRASRTLHIAHGEGLALFASTREPLELARKALGRRLRFEELRDGTMVELRDGEIIGPPALPRRQPLRRAQDRQLPGHPREAHARAPRARRVRLARLSSRSRAAC